MCSGGLLHIEFSVQRGHGGRGVPWRVAKGMILWRGLTRTAATTALRPFVTARMNGPQPGRLHQNSSKLPVAVLSSQPLRSKCLAILRAGWSVSVGYSLLHTSHHEWGRPSTAGRASHVASRATTRK